MVKYILLVVMIIASASCTSYWKRKSCEKRNWFDHSKNVALRGLRLEEDKTYMECKKVETQWNDAEIDRGFKAGMLLYCVPDTVYQMGSKGQSFNTDFCASKDLAKLRRRYFEGIVQYCKPKNAYFVGSKGEIYKKQCVNHDEVSFLREYKKGRIEYLKSQIQLKTNNIASFKDEINHKLDSRRQINFHIASTPRRKIETRKEVIDPNTGQVNTVTTKKVDPEILNYIDRLRADARTIDRDIDLIRHKQLVLSKEITDHKVEIQTLSKK